MKLDDLHPFEIVDIFYYFAFQLLEENLGKFLKSDLERIQRVLTTDFPECLESLGDEKEVADGEEEEEEQRRQFREGVLKITQHFLRSVKQDGLADNLESSKKVFIHHST